MSLTILFGIMTLAPAIVAVLLGVLARVPSVRIPALLAMGIAVLAAIVPIVGLILLTSDLAFATPLRFAWAGNATVPFAPIFRADGLTGYAAWGIAALIVPLLLWIVWMDAGRSAESGRRLLAELALTLGLEAAALHIVFADNLLWLGLAWLLLVALAWLLGEQGTAGGDLDYLGLICALAGPVLAVLAVLSVAITTKDHTLFDLSGRAAAGLWQIFLLAIGLTLASGGYPFAAWVRRRAAFSTPSGFAALTLLTLPVVIFFGARSWGALQNARGLWPEIGAVTPPITGGIALALLGTLTVAISGLLALGRRDGRTLVALLASAQVGWGLLGLGASQVVAGIGAIVLLATSVVGLGAMIAALVAGGVLTADDEPESAGPVPFGLAPRPLNLLAWCVGAATALGVPFVGGLVARHLITAGTLSGTKLGIPLLGLSWLGDALLAVALIRATVLAFRAEPDLALDGADEQFALDPAADDAGEAETGDALDDDADAQTVTVPTSPRGAELLELPGVVLALLGLALGIFPQVFLSVTALFATDQIAPENAANRALQIVPFGYVTTNSQWLPGILWLAALVLGIAVALLRWGTRRTAVTLETTGDDQLTGMESDSLDEPAAVWLDLAPSFTSPWTQVAGRQLIGGIDEDDDFAEAGDEAGDEDDDESGGEDEPAGANPPDDSDDSDEAAEPALATDSVSETSDAAGTVGAAVDEADTPAIASEKPSAPATQTRSPKPGAVNKTGKSGSGKGKSGQTRK